MKLDLQLYRGYANDKEIVVFGHVFESWGPSNFRVDRKNFYHIKSLWKMFTIRPLEGMEVQIAFKGLTTTTITDSNGFFECTFPYHFELEPGWHPYEVSCIHKNKAFGILETSELRKPLKNGITIISDIDDTFLISHSGNIWKKLYILLTRNVTQRKTFESVVEHYKALKGGRNKKIDVNSFYFVSSSEWNLYHFIIEFMKLNDLPKAVLRLKNIKTGLLDFLRTGGGDHDHKYHKIRKIISFYSQSQYVLIGDDSQKDIDIYERICTEYPGHVKAVYIRQVSKRPKPLVIDKIEKIQNRDIATCYFTSSTDAIEHSKRIGLIAAE